MTDKARYRQLRQDVAKWDRLVQRDSLTLDSIVATGRALRPAEFVDVARTADHGNRACEQRTAAQQALADWLASGTRDRLGTHQR